MNWYFPASALLNGITSLALSVYVLSQDTKKPINRSFSYYAFAMAFWSLSYFLWQFSNNKYDALFWTRMLMLGAIFIPPSFFHFIVNLLNLREKKKKELVFGYVLSVFFASISFSQLFIKDVVRRMQFDFWPVPGPLFHAFLAVFFCYITYSFLLALTQFRSLSGIARNQIKYVLVGTFVSIVAGSTNYFLWYDIHILPYGNALASIYVFTAAYAIIKFQLLDIKLALTRGTIFTLVYVVLFTGPVVIAINWEVYFESTLGKRWWIAFFICEGVFSYIAQLIYNFLSTKIEERLLREQRRFHTYLRDASHDMIHIRNLKELQSRVLHILTHGIRISHVKLFSYNKEQDYFELTAFRGIEEREQTGLPLARDHALIKLLHRVQKALVYDELDEMGYQRGINMRELKDEFRGLGAALIVPNFSRKRLIGFISLGGKFDNEVYNMDDINVLTTLSNQVALAMENASLYQNLERKVAERTEKLTGALETIKDDLVMAKNIQQNILPNNIEKIKGLEFCVKYYPMTEVGGDIFDVIELSDGIVRIFVADATGHGVQAALVTMLIKSEYEKFKFASHDPAELLENLNNTFIHSYKSLPVFFTCLVVDIDLTVDKLLFSSAGHLDQFIIRKGEHQTLSHTGRIIGVVENSVYKIEQHDFTPGEKLFLFTDGVLEETNSRNEEFGEKRMLNILLKKWDNSPEVIMDILKQELRFFTGRSEKLNIHDDILVLGIKYDEAVGEKEGSEPPG
ncbi:MAG: SpoIIE family protein phosphatase [bacterium]|nr:SpoIIE family protein phosphatase [bacterium]